jgi:hypothetical protein
MEEIKTISNTNSKIIKKSQPKLSKEFLIDMLDNPQNKYINEFIHQVEQDIRTKKDLLKSPPIKHVVIDINMPKLELNPK